MKKRKSVKEIIAEYGMTMNEFAKRNGLPSSSLSTVIKNWFPRGVKKPGVPRGRTAVIVARIQDLLQENNRES